MVFSPLFFVSLTNDKSLYNSPGKHCVFFFLLSTLDFFLFKQKEARSGLNNISTDFNVFFVQRTIFFFNKHIVHILIESHLF